jgi:prevent-host-death family protein
MREVSATEAARKFSELLDSVESDGERFVVVRRGRAVASIGPAVAASGRNLKQALRTHPPDDAWAGELHELRQSVGGARDPWHD